MKINSSNTLITLLTVTVDTSSTTGPSSAAQPNDFIIAQSVSGVASSSSIVHILIGFSKSNDIFACTFTNLSTETTVDNGLWTGSAIST